MHADSDPPRAPRGGLRPLGTPQVGTLRRLAVPAAGVLLAAIALVIGATLGACSHHSHDATAQPGFGDLQPLTWNDGRWDQAVWG